MNFGEMKKLSISVSGYLKTKKVKIAIKLEGGKVLMALPYKNKHLFAASLVLILEQIVNRSGLKMIILKTKIKKYLKIRIKGFIFNSKRVKFLIQKIFYFINISVKYIF